MHEDDDISDDTDASNIEEEAANGGDGNTHEVQNLPYCHLCVQVSACKRSCMLCLLQCGLKPGHLLQGRRMSQRSAKQRPKYNVDVSDEDEQDGEQSSSADDDSYGVDASKEQLPRERVRSMQEESALNQRAGASQQQEEAAVQEGVGVSPPEPGPSRWGHDMPCCSVSARMSWVCFGPARRPLGGTD